MYMAITDEIVPVYKSYKDRVFRLLFKDKKRLLELYNALNDTSYTDENALEITTLDNAIFMSMKNDVSFIVDSDMCLYEHQSTYCPNMPLRGFLYFADLYRKYTKGEELSSRKRIKLPTPYYVVFYNGTERTEKEFTQKLSDAFTGGPGCIELMVRSVNINYENGHEILNKCTTLCEYAYFVEEIRRHCQSMTMEEAVTIAVNECIEKGILKDFLTEQKAEVIAMSIYQYNEEVIKKELFEDGVEVGYQKGCEAGRAQGIIKTARKYGASEQDILAQLMEELDVDETCAREYLNTN